jgi:hypothetical protein
MSSDTKIVGADFKYCGVNYDYDSETSCSESGCDSEGICRCGVIVNQRVESVDVCQMADEIYKLYFDNSKSTDRNNKINSVLYGTGKELDTYCIDRVLRAHMIWDNDKWSISVESGYYGQEMGRITIESPYDKKIQDDIETVLSLNTIKEKIDFILNLEYGYLLPELDGCDYEISTININDVIFGSDGHYKKIQTQNVEHYVDINYKGIRGVVKEEGGKYKIIDGYHRMYASGLGKIKKDSVRVILVKNN